MSVWFMHVYIFVCAHPCACVLCAEVREGHWASSIVLHLSILDNVSDESVACCLSSTGLLSYYILIFIYPYTHREM